MIGKDIPFPMLSDQDGSIGMQLMGRKFDEGTLLKTAKAFEGSTDFNSRPKL
jgi:Asp-tRNA(Asn)/Glu-tRNA(Gln) amidotransferase A subunit family amidase